MARCSGCHRRLVKADPSNAEHWINRVAMYMQLGNRQQAMKFHAELPRSLCEGDYWGRQGLAQLKQGLRQLGWL